MRTVHALMAAVLLATLAAAWAEVPAQAPLLNRVGSSVKPNVLLTLDDSGSMLAQSMPEDSAHVGPWTVRMPTAYRFHPDDTGRQAIMDPDREPVSARPGSLSVHQRKLRSPDVNTIYYNPEVRYRPWARADGSRYEDADPTAARTDPDHWNKTIDLTRVLKLCDGKESGSRTHGCSGVEEAFDPGLYYRLGRENGQQLDPSRSGSYTEYSINVQAFFTRHPERTDCAMACTQAQERRNFANWFVYYRSRQLFMKAAVAEAFHGMEDSFRLGWGRINKPPGTVDGIRDLPVLESGVRDFGNARKAFFDWLHGMPPTNQGTPLREAMQAAGEYYSAAVAGGPWSDSPGDSRSTTEMACRRAYHVLVTDGYWSDGNRGGLKAVGNADNESGPTLMSPRGHSYTYQPVRPYLDDRKNQLADYAMHYWKRDLRPDLANKVPPTPDNPAFWQHMTTFTVGVGVRGALDPGKDLPALQKGDLSWSDDRIDDLWHAALNGRGEYFSISRPAELSAAIRAAVNRAIERELREAGVATSSSVLRAGSRKYVPRYKTSTWTGDVEAYALDAKGQAGALAWSAKDKLPAWSERQIVTWDRGIAPARGVPFRWDRLSEDARRALAAQGTAADLVDFLRGDRSRENAIDGFRVREGILGDFVNSTPVFAQAGFDPDHRQLPGIGLSYPAYAVKKEARSGVFWIGGNDGMLHGFKDTRGSVPATDGQEVFAYVPRAVYAHLGRLASRRYGGANEYHRYFVDGPLHEVDVHLRAPRASAASWRNYLLGSTGAGARAVFALDITDPPALGPDSIRWEISADDHPELGHVLFPLQAGPLPDGRWVAVFGNGYGGASQRPVLFVVELETGKVHQLPVGDAGRNGLGGAAIAKDAQGYIRTLYAGDLQGKLWKFDYADSADSGFRLAGGGAWFDVGEDRPIVQAPVVFQRGDGVRVVVFGTGRLFTEQDADDKSPHAVYGVADLPSDRSDRSALPLTPSRLEPRTLVEVPTRSAGGGAETGATYFSIAGRDVNWNSQRGWILPLTGNAVPAGLRVIYPLQKVNQTHVFINAVAPAAIAQPCESTHGAGLNLLYDVHSGLTGQMPMFDTSGDGLINANDAPASAYSSAADGVETIVHFSRPTGDAATPGAGCAMVSIQNTTSQADACVPEGGAEAGSRTLRQRTWRRILNPPIR